MTAEQWYFDDFEVGQACTTMGRTVTETDIVTFVTFAGVFEETFINVEYAREHTIFKARVAPAMLPLVLAEGLYVLTGHTHQGRAFLGLTDLRLAAPVLAGDTIRATVTVESTRPTSRPGRGIVTLEHRVLNQDDVEVMAYRTTRMLACRPATTEALAKSARML
jgi:acyl dehydratase